MNFLNQSLLWGAAAFTIPLIIHILNRSRFKTIEWGAMHLLDSVVKVNHRRFRIDQLILLLIRCAIPILLAFCLARPVLTGAEALLGQSPVSLILLIDDSYSMQTEESASTRFEEAIAAASQVIQNAPRGSDFSVILTGGSPRHLLEKPVFDPEIVVRKLKSLRPLYGASDFLTAFEEASLLLPEVTNPQRQLVVISDFQQNDWESNEQLESVREQLDSLPLSPQISFLNIGKQQLDNVAIESLDFPSRILGVGQQLNIRVNVRNNDSTEVSTLRLLMNVDGVEVDASQLTLTAGSTTQVVFPVAFDSPGSHLVEFQIASSDSLVADNSYAAAFSVRERLPVLLVDGSPSREPLQGETDYLSVALTPFTFGRLTLSDLIETKTVSMGQFRGEDLEFAEVVILANVSKLKSDVMKDLESFVSAGGALFVTCGNKVDLKWSRETFFAEGQGLLPLPYQTMQGGEETDTPARVVAQHFDHPALAEFNDRRIGDLSTAEIKQWYRLEEVGTDADRPPPTVLAHLNSGDPFLVIKEYGEGLVLQMATTCDADWTNLPLTPAYVPFMQQLVTYLGTRNAPQQNIMAGATTVIPLESDTPYETISVTTPTGTTRSIPVVSQNGSSHAILAETELPGHYQISLPDQGQLDVVVNTSRRESTPQILDTEAVKELSQKLNGQVFASFEDYLQREQIRRHGRDVWQFALMGLLLLMFLEVMLQQRFARVHS